jgi:uncharacterized protein (TIGR02611 family)
MTWQSTPQIGRRVVRIAAGFVLLVLGVIALVLPGPGWLMIALGLALLASEFAWARRLLDRVKAGAGKARNVIRRRRDTRSQHRGQRTPEEE